MTKILVADDESDLEILIKQKFRQKIRDQKYEFIFALNGKEALEKIQQHPDVEMVLSDINMPEMDGLTFLTKLNENRIPRNVVNSPKHCVVKYNCFKQSGVIVNFKIRSQLRRNPGRKAMKTDKHEPT